MTESPNPAAPGHSPRVLPIGRYVALVVGACVLVALVGALTKNYVEPTTGFWASWGIVFAVTLGIAVGMARTVGNPSSPIVCGALVGLGFISAGEEVGRSLGKGWEFFCKYLPFVVAYFLWMSVFHKWIATRR